MKRPAFQFYPADWLGNKNLRRCSVAARGAWIDVLCLLHDGEEYGVLRWPLADIAATAGHALKLLHELVDKLVLKGGDHLQDDYQHRPLHAGKEGEPQTLVKADGGPCWYSSRMVRDEWARQRRGGDTRFGAPDATPNRAPNREPKPQPNRIPTARVGDESGIESGTGASFASASNPHEVRSELPTKSHPRASDNGGDKNRPENQRRNASSLWRTDDNAALAKAASLNIKPNPGEGWPALRARIDQAQSDKDRAH